MRFTSAGSPSSEQAAFDNLANAAGATALSVMHCKREPRCGGPPRLCGHASLARFCRCDTNANLPEEPIANSLLVPIAYRQRTGTLAL